MKGLFSRLLRRWRAYRVQRFLDSLVISGEK